LNYRLSEMNLPRFPLLSDVETKRLLVRAKDGDEIARETLINCNLKLVFNTVQRFSNRGHELEDLFQIGTIGLIKSIDKFDLSYNVKFSTYAVPLIIGEIRRFLRDDSPIKMSRTLKETVFKVNRARNQLAMNLGREATIAEIAANTGLEIEDIVIAMEAAYIPTSIFETIYQDGGDPIFVIDSIAVNTSENGAWFEKLAIKEVLQKLPEREKKVLILRFFEDKTQSQVASMIDISQVQVSRIERQALKHIKVLIDTKEEI
jgi:RNA polymerase sporulation-specific sigma factor